MPISARYYFGEGIVVATLIVAASFQVLQERIQQAINRLMFGQRDEPQAVLLELVKQLTEGCA
jgi:hypothetical protein